MHRILFGIPHKLYNSIEVNFKQWRPASKLNVGVSNFPMTEPLNRMLFTWLKWPLGICVVFKCNCVCCFEFLEYLFKE